MKIQLFLGALLGFVLFGTISGQQLSEDRSFHDTRWLQIPEGSKVNQIQFFDEYAQRLGLTPDSEMKWLRTTNDQQNGIHYHYQQYYKNVKVYGAKYILHEENQYVEAANGIISPNLNLDIRPQISAEEALQIAKEDMQASVYTWENKKNSESIPIPELVIINTDYPLWSGQMKLAYIFELRATNPHSFKKYIVDAVDGGIILSFNTLMSCFGEKGTAHTLYHGDQEIDTELENGEFLLKDLSRGNGIQTRSITGKIYSDSDNDWEKGTNDQKNGALDMFWGCQKTYDFYKSKFNRNSIDGKDIKISAILLDTSPYNNAYWDDKLFTINFGIGDNVTYKPFTAIDVVGHELTHGVTQFSAGLEYLYESGAMNESFSDIFGKSVEYYYDNPQFDWLIGGKVTVAANSALRSMEDPNRFGNPKYYKGASWFKGTADNGGVHYNSGVLNYWFYLLCEGKSGKNEAKIDFNVQRLGFDTTIQLAYHMLTDYLTPTSTYVDARTASLQIAANWWGSCSDAYKQVAEAWKAVGLGGTTESADVQILNNKTSLTSCKDGLYQFEVRLINLSCSNTYTSNTPMELSYQVAPKGAIVKETYILTEDFKPGQDLKYTFTTPVLLTKPSTTFYVAVELANDIDTSNNHFTVAIAKSSANSAIEHDILLSRINVSGSPCPNNNNVYRGSGQAVYNGCSIIPINTAMELRLNYKDTTIVIPFKTTKSTYPGGQVPIPGFDIPRTFLGLKKANGVLVYANDTVTKNNIANFQVVFLEYTKKDEVETFNNFRFDSSKITLNIDSFNTVQILNKTSLNGYTLHCTGGKILNSNNFFIPALNDDLSNFIRNNIKFSSTIYLCADIKGLVNPKLEYNLLQQLSETDYESFGMKDPSFAASTRIIYRNITGGAIFTEVINNASVIPAEWRHKIHSIPAETYAIEITNLCLKGSVDSTTGEINPDGDLIIMDDLVITADAVGVVDFDEVGFSILPNPNHGHFVVHLNQPNQKSSELQVYNGMGNRVAIIPINKDAQEVILPSQLPSGQYIILYNAQNGKSIRKKLIIL